MTGKKVEEKKDDTKLELFDANQGLMKRSGGPYLDELEALKAEERRAVVEDRDPDLDNPGPYAGTQLVPKQYLTEKDIDHSHAALGGYVELEHDPVMVVDIPEEKNEADPTQVDYDNDSQKVAAMVAAASVQESKEKLGVSEKKADVSGPSTASPSGSSTNG